MPADYSALLERIRRGEHTSAAALSRRATSATSHSHGQLNRKDAKDAKNTQEH